MSVDWNAMSDAQFRAIVGRFFDANCPQELRFASRRLRWTVVKPWFMTLSREGWVAPSWPVEWGGMGLSPVKQLIYIEEYERHGAPVMQTQSLTNLGPILIARGTDAQRRKYLPRIISGEDVWVQGYSEPNAGSDLAALRTEARLEGNEFIINGQKIWTTMGFDGTHMFALVRTDKAAKKQAGISFVMFDMNQPGISVRPIRDISGGEEFCEVFLQDVRAHSTDLVGDINGGWEIAKTLLGFERVWSGSPRHSLIALARLERCARANGTWADPVFRDRHSQLVFDVRDLSAMYERLVRSLGAGKGFGLEASLLKVTATETSQRITELLLELAGSDGSAQGPVTIGGELIDPVLPFLESRAPTIYGGSNQIQRNILARQWLGLPG